MSNQNVCNICGANYEYIAGRWVCPACGAFKPEELSNEEVTLLYNANQKLRLSDFDEAEKEFSDIIQKYPQNPNGYWGRLLAKYGIKYEDDFDGRKIPTCYATSIESVMSDKDYHKAIELADADTKAYYQKQAEYIERVREEWVEKARKEKPYDIFICYKDSDLANGIERTKDSVAVQELYIHLTKQGYRVFFSRECLRDKVGEKYEPYIFNALSTAKVMLIYGSSSEYITSTWLKNEWTRYEKRLRAGEKKPNSLLVACDGFSPSELPRVLSSMQCLDATKRTFYGDLDAIIKKIIKGEDKPQNSNNSTKSTNQAKHPKNKTSTKTKKKQTTIVALIAIVIAIVLYFAIPNLINNSIAGDGNDIRDNNTENSNNNTNDTPSPTVYPEITFDANGGSGTMSAQQAKAGETITLNQNAFTRTGYTFAGWATSSTGNAVYDNRASYTVGTDSSYTLYAAWTTVTYNITYNLNGGTNHVDNPSSYTVESGNITLESPTRSGYIFKGWYKDSAFTKQATTIDVTYPKNTTLYAKWETFSFVYTIESGEVTITDCKSNGDIIIPAEIEGYPVVKIEDAAFKYHKITSVAIPEGVVSIGKEAFHYCDLLTTVSLPSTLETIGDYAFYKCIKLTDITLPNNLKTIGEYAFSGCEELASVAIPNGVKTIRHSSFRNCKGLTSVDISGEVNSIESSAFADCESLVSIVIPGSVKTIGESAFESCDNLVTVVINDGVASIGKYAFRYCYYLQNITIGNEVAVIEDYAFQNCNRLSSVVIPDSVVTIGTSAFSGCTHLASVSLGKNLFSIGYSAFLSCESLVEVFDFSDALDIKAGESKNGYVSRYALDVHTSKGVASGVSVDDGYIFYKTDNYCYLLGYLGTEVNLTLPDSCNGSKYKIYENAFKSSNIESIIISDGVIEIEENAFLFCNKLNSITIGSNVKVIESYAFSGCDNLSSITFNDKSGWYYARSYSSSTKTEVSEVYLASDVAAAQLILKNHTYYWYNE